MRGSERLVAPERAGVVGIDRFVMLGSEMATTRGVRPTFCVQLRACSARQLQRGVGWLASNVMLPLASIPHEQPYEGQFLLGAYAPA